MIITAAKATEAAKVLGVELPKLNPDALSKAYRTATKDCHPDSGNHNPERWAQVSWSKEVLVRWLERQPAAEPEVEAGTCRACAGSGRVAVSRVSFGKQTTLMCVMCNGSGVPQPGTAFTGRDG